MGTYPPIEKRPYPERNTGDFVRDSLQELEFQLEHAVVANDIRRVVHLIKLGANKDAPLDYQQRTALMLAAQAGYMELVMELVEGQNVDINLTSLCGFRAIDYAGKEEHRFPNDNDIVSYLKKCGSNHTWWGAAYAGDIRRIDTYLENGQDINDINPVLRNYNAVDCAIFNGHAKAAQFLIARGGMCQIRNAHMAVKHEMLWSIGREDAFYYKSKNLEDGKPFTVDIKWNDIVV